MLSTICRCHHLEYIKKYQWNCQLQYSTISKKNKGKCEVYTAPFDVKLSESTVVIPDISVICDSSKLTDKGCSGAPDWIIEIVSSNAIHDYLLKLNLYQAYGVREYWIVDPKKQSVTVYRNNPRLDL